MSSEWSIVKLGNLATFQEGYVNPSQRESTYFDGPIKWLRATDLNDARVVNTSRTLSNEGFQSAGKSAQLFAPGTLAISKSGTIGRLGILGDYMCGNRAVINIKPGSEANARFLFFVLRHLRPIIETLAEGSVQKNLYVSTLSNLDVPAPPPSVQQGIADILGALDDRIALLRETNATLEAIAQALFRSWFVDFDPVRAKRDGRAPEGMDEATAALFPDSFEESELGEVPRGWAISTLGECTAYLNRGISPKYVEEGGIVVLNQKCIRDFAVDPGKARRHDPSQRKVDGRELQPGDVLVNSTGVGTLGRVAQVVELEELSIVDSHVTVVRANDRLTWNFLGLALMRMQPQIEQFGEGTTGQTELSRVKLAGVKVVVPPSNVLSRFDEAVMPLRMRIAANQAQAKSLASLRDTLLPRLISGQLRLPEAAKAIEPALA